MSVVKELWRGRKFYTAPYPLVGPKTSGVANIPVDILKQGLNEDTMDTISVHLVGTIVVAGAAPGAASGAYNPQGLFVLSNQSTAPQAAGLIPVNAVSSRGIVVDNAVLQGAFPADVAIPDAAGVQPIDTWIHYRFKRDGARKGIEYAHPLKKWKTDTLTLTVGTRDQLFTGGANTWDMSGVTVEFWADLDVASDPDNIHAVEIFEQDFNILASNANFQINQLPQGCFYDNLYLVTEDAGALTDGVINNIDVEGAGRFWLPQGEANALFVRNRYTRTAFYDPNITLTGIYVLPLRDGMWSRALDASSAPIVIKLDVTSLSATTVVRLIGRKIVPGAIKRTIKLANGGKQITGLPNV